ncbi:hypothetical protein D3C71_2062160 [compost metagenome]
MRLRALSRAIERSRARMIGSPWDCFSSSLTSCLVIISSVYQWCRDQKRSAIARTAVANRMTIMISLRSFAIVENIVTGSENIKSSVAK